MERAQVLEPLTDVETEQLRVDLGGKSTHDEVHRAGEIASVVIHCAGDQARLSSG